MTGTGTWTFDRKENVPSAYDMQFKLTVKSGNSSTVLPISVKYNRISAEKLAEMEATVKKVSRRSGHSRGTHLVRRDREFRISLPAAPQLDLSDFRESCDAKTKL